MTNDPSAPPVLPRSGGQEAVMTQWCRHGVNIELHCCECGVGAGASPLPPEGAQAVDAEQLQELQRILRAANSSGSELIESARALVELYSDAVKRLAEGETRCPPIGGKVGGTQGAGNADASLTKLTD